jgi:transposase
MRQLRSSSLVPPGFIVEHAEGDRAEVRLTLRHRAESSLCPECGTAARRIHSRYQRLLGDLPMAGLAVRLRLQARRFRCDAGGCRRRVFTERFAPAVLAPWARRTSRLDELVHHLAIALGGRPASRLARRLMLPVSKDALLRVVRRCGGPRLVPPTVIGIDDWAWRRNQRYGTIICDLERRRTIALLPDREPATARAWLAGQPRIAVVARDRGGGYALAAAGALPEATQVADRWHLMENASRAFLDAVRTSMRQIRSAVDTATVDVALLTAAERIQYEGYLCREEANAAILRLRADGIPIKEIVRRTGHSRGLVRKVVRGQRTDLFRTRESSLEVHLPWLEEQWSAGSRNGAELWRRLRQHGFRGSLRVVTEWATRRRRTERAPTGTLGRTPSARAVAGLMSVGRDALSRTETLTVAAIETGVPLLVEARELIASFQGMIRTRTAAKLGP